MAAAAAGGTIRGETKEERERRRAEKERTVRSYRTQILTKVNKETQGAKLSKDFACPTRYRNDLPALPIGPKMLEFPFDEDMAYAYDPINGVSSERGALHRVHGGPDLGLLFDLVDNACYVPGASTAGAALHPLDAKITSETYAKPAAKAAKARDVLPQVEWMMRTQHMHLDLFDNVYKHVDPTQLADDIQARKRAAIEAAFRRGARKARIEASFAAVSDAAPVVHPTNRGVAPVRAWSVLPDPERWTIDYLQVAFDGPTDGDDALPPPAKRARMERALLRPRAEQPVNLKEGTVLADYLLPVVVPSADESSPLPLAPSRAYHMVVERVDPAAGDEAHVLFWHGGDAPAGRAGTVTFVPMRARAVCTGVKAAAPSAAGSAASVVVVPRPQTAAEADRHAEATADLTSTTPAAVKTAVAERRAERQRAAAEAAAAAAAAAAAEPAPAAEGGAASASSTYGKAGAASTAPAVLRGNSASLSDVSADEEED